MPDFDAFFPKQTQINFTIRNLSAKRKIHVFGYPIFAGQTRDLLLIPQITEDDIRSSLIKGELANFIRQGVISIVSSSIDLTQFDVSQQQFLAGAGVTAAEQTSVSPTIPNMVSSTNTISLGPSNPLVFTSAPITRKSSGYMEVSASACPILAGGGGIVMTFYLYRDYGTPASTALGTGSTPIKRKILPAGVGQDAEGVITPFIDIITDSSPHTYSLYIDGAGQNMTDPAGHCVITVKEL